MTDALATLSIDGPHATLTLSRASKRNALSLELLNALHAKLDQIDDLDQSADQPHVLTITGDGKSFCAGMDLKQVRGDAGAGLELLTTLARLTHRLRNLPMVTVALVNGAAIGGGCGLVCVADFALTHDHATLGFPEVELGLCPAVVAPWVVRRIGSGPAREVMLAGGTCSGQRAAELGLVTTSSPDAEALASEHASLIESLGTAGPQALRATKQLLNSLDGSDDKSVLLEAARLSAQVLASDDAQARLSARFGS